MSTLRLVFAAAALLHFLANSSAAADNGRIEINQAAALAGGVTQTDTPGFPVTLDQPGSYVLTGNLQVPSGAHGILFETSDAGLDLNNFSIFGPGTCAGTSGAITCSGVVGTTYGISAITSGDGNRIRIHDGFVRGFQTCIRLLGESVIDSVIVRDCSSAGIVSDGSLVTDSRVMFTGNRGIQGEAASPVFVRGNVVSHTQDENMWNASALGGNSCDDGSCSRRGTRRYYLTPGEVPGDGALTACDSGFHMASIHEIWDYSSLEYDTSRGASYPDAGEGPPATIISLKPAGWARTGGASQVFEFHREGNCALWTSDEATDFGGIWKFSNSADGEDESERWRWSSQTCEKLFQVWCVED